MKKVTKSMIAALTALLLIIAGQFCGAATWTVTSTEDQGEGTLRQALVDASDGDIIDFRVSGTITLITGQLTVDKSVSIVAQPEVDLTVDGNMTYRVFSIAKGKTVTISGLTITHGYALNSTGGGVYNAGMLTLDDCTLSDNSAMLGGGGVSSEGDLTITGCTLSGNKTGVAEDYYYGGGAVAVVLTNVGDSYSSVRSHLTIENSLLTGNEAPSGGGIVIDIAGGDNKYAEAHASVTVINSTLSDNSATSSGDWSYGGAMAIIVGGDSLASAQVTMENCTLSGNSAFGSTYNTGGAIAIFTDSIYHSGWLTLKNSTLSDNSAEATDNGSSGLGGAIHLLGLQNNNPNDNSEIYYASQVTLDNCTLSGNYDIDGVSGILNDGGKVELKNTILANDSNGVNLDNKGLFSSSGGLVVSHGYNLSTDDGGGFLNKTGDLTSSDPMLGPLADNGGPTFTHALLVGSPAIDAGDEYGIEYTTVIDGESTTIVPPITTDQRGIKRPQGAANDIGAFEVEVSETEYQWSGVLPPINPDGSSIFKARSTVPVKFMLTGSSAGITDLAAVFAYSKIEDGSPGAVNESVSTSAATTGNLFRYDPFTGEYIFNWSTKGLTQGSYRLYIELGDGVERFVDVGLK